MQNLMLSCDWGTSSFRLRLVDVQTHQIISEVLSNDGIAGTYNRWKIYSAQQETGKEHFYLQQVQQHIRTLSEKVSMSLDGIPVVISGMACSSIGIKELPYASLPFSIDGSEAIVQRLKAGNGFPADVWLISGASHPQDVMRGEETQLIGLAGMDGGVYSAEDSISILPGTHSKHIAVQNGKIVDFKTYMTGELFQVMTNHSILRDAISGHSGKQPSSQAGTEAFRLGIRQSGTASLLHTLFTVRVNQLFKHLTNSENFFYLSGLLIGTELRSLSSEHAGRIILCSGGNVYPLYQLAIEELDLQHRTVFIAPGIMDNAAMEGQIKIFQHQKDLN